MDEIRKVVYRCENNASDYDGDSSRNWFGEDSYSLGDGTYKGDITKIDTGFAFNSQTMPVVRIWVEGQGKVCEIPWHMVCRLYYK